MTSQHKLYEFKLMPYNIPQAAIAMANAPCLFILQDIVVLNHSAKGYSLVQL